MTELDSYIFEAGPFDSVMGFSQGAAVAVSLIIQKLQEDRSRWQLYSLFKCAVFFSGGVPLDISVRPGLMHQRLMNYEHDEEVVELLTAHI